MKHRPGGRNDSRSPSPKPRRSDASESGEVWFFNVDLCACQKGLCVQDLQIVLKYYDELMLWILQLMSHESLLLLITKMRGGCMLWVCVCRCMFLHIMGV